ncbi:hypothetical protein, partial [Pseudomonas syringae group genomosp. 7]|uniref:hypothetical protein n=1 Tax=Pseudomonas syringae group genomosp. 7 TaxID=251699 RepID=UPI00376FD387
SNDRLDRVRHCGRDHNARPCSWSARMSRRLLLLTIALLMFPQLAQTLYSPALADLAKRFS